MRPGILLVALLPLAAVAAGSSILNEIARILAERSLDPPPAQEVLDQDLADIDRYLALRDPYARYLDPEENASFRSGGAAVGIGVQLSEVQGRYFLMPIPGGPAWNEGLLRRAQLLSVEGRSVQGQSMQWVAQQLKGQAGSSVLMVVEAPDARLQALRVSRESFRAPSVSYLEEDGIPVLRIWDFRARETLADLRRGLARILSYAERPVIDLRFATGGDLYEALDCTALFLPDGSPVAVVEEARGNRRELLSPSGLRIVDQPIALVIGPGTASAAESFALALQYHGAARLVGEPSYGKCLTQTLAPLSNGGALLFSNGRLFGPGGIACNSDGLVPDQRVSDAEARSLGELLGGKANSAQGAGSPTPL